MQPLAIDPDALRSLAAARGIDTVAELASRARVSKWVLYRALNDNSSSYGQLMPSHVTALVEMLGTDGFVREGEPAT